MTEQSSQLSRISLIGLGLLSTIYSLIVLIVVAMTPDPGWRCLLIDHHNLRAKGSRAEQSGVGLIQTGWNADSEDALTLGDRLIRWNDVRVDSSANLSQQLLGYRPELVGPATVTIETTGSVTVRRTLPVPADPAPPAESFLSLLWFLLEIVVLGLSGVAVWRRPYDRPTRVFFAMCACTLSAFIGGFHWWLLSGSPWLTIPFALCAMLVPVITLHFFLVYPRPKWLLVKWPRATWVAVYSLPVASMVWFLVTESLLWSSLSQPESDNQRLLTTYWLNAIRGGVYFYLLIGAVYFLATLAALVHSVSTTRNPLERQQVTWILWAALIASGFIGYTLMLAFWDRITFARGGGRLPMFLASVLFTVAYAVGMVRFKLMLPETWTGRQFTHQFLRVALTVGVALVTAAVALAVGYNTAPGPVWSLWLIGVSVVMVFIACTAGRDVLQRWLERRFLRDRQRTDRVLQRIHHSVVQLADVHYLSERTLALCREALQADWAAMYLREPQTGDYRLVAVEGAVTTLPLQWSPPEKWLTRLTQEGPLFAGGQDATVPDNPLAQMGAEAVQWLEIEGDVAGLIWLGPKQAGTIYSAEDATFLVALTQITGVAMHCARVHQELSQLNGQLRLKGERIAQQKQQILMLQSELATRPTPTIETDAEFHRETIKGSSPSLMRVLETARKVAPSETTVLLRGESGTGKELLARVLHENSPRRKGPMICVHCAALAPSLLESELFGHVKGAFTGATADKRGRFDLAQGGTLFLDEIGELSPETQVKLLRVLQEREIEPVGGHSPVAIDVRMIAATHRPLEQMIREGKFREDLYYRLNVVSLALPPLRERKEDLHELAAGFLLSAAARAGKRINDFADEALDALIRYEWPGNVRELENVIERAVVLADDTVIQLSDLPTDIQQGLRTERPSSPLVNVNDDDEAYTRFAETEWRTLSAQEERRTLLMALQRSQGNKARAARLLGLPRSTFFSKLKKHSLAD
ncbi:MAG TPA: sigma 54-interacting transcriptional regulator [Planctomycetaceae bacterium]|nr:sigma 54-interacting transcriptional regulator [Planctomycetaceae bacterium]